MMHVVEAARLLLHNDGGGWGHWQGHSKWITSLAWEPAHLRLPARRFVSGSQDRSLRVWDAVTLQCQFSMSSHSLAVSCVRWGGDGLLYSASKDATINVWDSKVWGAPPPHSPYVFPCPPCRCSGPWVAGHLRRMTAIHPTGNNSWAEIHVI